MAFNTGDRKKIYILMYSTVSTSEVGDVDYENLILSYGNTDYIALEAKVNTTYATDPNRRIKKKIPSDPKPFWVRKHPVKGWCCGK